MSICSTLTREALSMYKSLQNKKILLMDNVSQKPVMEVFTTNVFPNYASKTRSQAEDRIKKSSSDYLLPIKSKLRLRKCASESSEFNNERQIRDLELDRMVYRDSGRVQVKEGFSSSSDENDESGHVNISFDYESNRFAEPFKTFNENIKDGGDIQYIGKGRCVVSDLLKNRLVVFSKSGRSKIILQNDETVEPWGLALHENIILVTSRRKKLVIKMPQMVDHEESSFGAKIFQEPCGIAVTKDHKIIVSDIQAKRVSVHEWAGNKLYDLCPPENQTELFKLPRYITVSPLGDIVVSDSGNHCIYIFSDQGNFKRTFGSYGVGDGQFKTPYGVSCDHFGNIFVADHYNDRISFFSREGEFVGHLLTRSDGIFHPQGITLSHDMKIYLTHGSLRAYEVKVFRLLCKPMDRNIKICSI